jgi:hypothetical protein
VGFQKSNYFSRKPKEEKLAESRLVLRKPQASCNVSSSVGGAGRGSSDLWWTLKRPITWAGRNEQGEKVFGGVGCGVYYILGTEDLLASG